MRTTVREATPDDAEAVCNAHVASIEGLGGERYTQEQVLAWARGHHPAEYPITDDAVVFVVAERGESLLGFGWMKPDADDYFRDPVEGEITAVYVRPSAARKGVGTRIYGELERRARNQDVGSLGLWASLNAVSFYEEQGYERVTEHEYEYGSGVSMTVVEMRKELG